MDIPPAIHRFIAAGLVAGDICLPSHYPSPDELEDFQLGFRVHGLTGEDLTSTQEGEWQPGWYVIALNGMDDPFFVDVREAEAGYPVYYALHGAGRWTATVIAGDLAQFAELLAELTELQDDKGRTLQYLEAHVDLGNLLWKEVHENTSAPEIEKAPAVDEAEWVRGQVWITEIGDQKLKVVQFLRAKRNLSPQEALLLSKQPEVMVKEGCLIHLRRTMEHLESLGATVVFRANEES